MTLEYYSLEDFREVANDQDSPSKFDDDEIERGHDEVVRRLEGWARSSWVTRTWRLFRLVQHGYLNLSRTPILSITSFDLAGESVLGDDYVLDAEGGRLMWGDWTTGVPILDGGPFLAEVEWEFGFGAADPADIDWEIKRPTILATASLLRPQKERTKVPPNARSFSTNRASFDLRFERATTRPWPWDEAMSSQVRAAWDPFRFRSYMS
jgi:hypothetical protein